MRSSNFWKEIHYHKHYFLTAKFYYGHQNDEGIYLVEINTFLKNFTLSVFLLSSSSRSSHSRCGRSCILLWVENVGSVIHIKRLNKSAFVFAIQTAFRGFGQAKILHRGSVLDSSQFLILPQLPQKIMQASKVIKINSKIVILLC